MAQHKWCKEIKAWADGAQIESRMKPLPSSDDWFDWKLTKTPGWNTTGEWEYRVKPTPKLVPFDFSDAEKLIGKVVRSKEDGAYYVIGYVSKNTVMGFSYKTLLVRYEFLDGSPCGKYVNE